MSETKMPAVEVEGVAEVEEQNSYELAFHVLPTVAEGEVSGVFESIKSLITTNGGELFDEESPERFDLAYEVVKHIEGKNRKFTSAYFGWARFKSVASAIEAITEGVEENADILRYITIRLTKVEEANPFRFHEALAAEKTVSDVEEVKTPVEKKKKVVEEKKDEKVEEKKEEVEEKVEEKEEAKDSEKKAA